MKKFVATIALGCLVSGCGVPGRLAAVGKPPKMSQPEDVPAPAFEPSLAAPAERLGRAAPAEPQQAPSASLFRTGAASLFSDQRAAGKGDIVTIRINIADKAEVGNNTSRNRGGGEQAGIAKLLGLETLLPSAITPDKLVDASSSSSFTGGGNTARSENINMTMAAIVTDVLPNGNLMIRGRQEVRVNFELRELIITGLVRPQDIARDNSIRHSQIAEARIIYGGKGQLTDAQQARWGQQIYDALFPF